MDAKDQILIAKIRQLHGIQPNNEWRVLFKERLNKELYGGEDGVIEAVSLKSFTGVNNFGAFSKFAYIRNILVFPKLSNFSRNSFAAAAFVIVFLFASGFTLFNAAAKSLPGDKLYVIKLTEERLRFMLAQNEETRVTLRFEFLNNRFSEVDASMRLNEPTNTKGERVTVAVSAIKKEISDINNDLDRIMVTSEPKKAVEMAKRVDEKINLYSNTLSATEIKLPEQVKKKIKSSVSETLKVAEEAMNKTLLVLIENHGEAPLVSTDELVQRVEQRIEKTEAKIRDIQEQAQILSKEPVKSENNSDGHTISPTPSDTNESNDKLDQTRNILSNEAQVMLKDARIKLQLKDLSGALKNTTASETIVKATEKVIDSTPTFAPSSTITPTPSISTTIPTVAPIPTITETETDPNLDSSDFKEIPSALPTVIPLSPIITPSSSYVTEQ